ncbi:MAG: 50S ribosomal protein L13 [Planctomycetales bacterium]|nr:50S ribosomal protein L13 [Planctomycetales bacterium]
MITATLDHTWVAKKNEVPHRWWIVDAKGKVLGRLATRVAMVLQGKHRPTYTDNVDTGDCVVVVNAGGVELTRKKPEKKIYRYHTYWIGGLKEIPFKDLMARHPEKVVRLAIKRMLPKSKLGRQMIKKLKIYPGAEHPHSAQRPEPLAV